MTLGVGGTADRSRAPRPRRKGPPSDAGGHAAVTERFTAITPQLSFNFGDGDGWSYISGGLGPSQRRWCRRGAPSATRTRNGCARVNYGGGARWFIKSHLAFTFDVRFHDIDPGASFFGLPGAPRSRMLIIGAGLSLK